MRPPSDSQDVSVSGGGGVDVAGPGPRSEGPEKRKSFEMETSRQEGQTQAKKKYDKTVVGVTTATTTATTATTATTKEGIEILRPAVPVPVPVPVPSSSGQESAGDLEARLIEEGIFDANFVSLKEDAGVEMLTEILGLYITDSADTIGELEDLVRKKKKNSGSSGSLGPGPPPSAADSVTVTLELEESEYERVRYLVHRFKGSCLNIGTAILCVICEEIREACVKHEGQQTRDAIGKLRRVFDAVRKELEKYLSHFEEQPESPTKKTKTL